MSPGLGGETHCVFSNTGWCERVVLLILSTLLSRLRQPLRHGAASSGPDRRVPEDKEFLDTDAIVFLFDVALNLLFQAAALSLLPCVVVCLQQPLPCGKASLLFRK